MPPSLWSGLAWVSFGTVAFTVRLWCQVAAQLTGPLWPRAVVCTCVLFMMLIGAFCVSMARQIRQSR